ncbi:MAG: tRNA 2-thiouridine(34) synthase MnmA [Crocinitomicaceae bacterium]|nr:tRNA 2-thiouridine(34) synthase MnmA [Crocinitomicaceae bacterium]
MHIQITMSKRVVVGLSGGVDSSVAAYLLKQEGYEVIGLFMKNWHDTSVTISDECPWIDDSNDALLVANKLGIPFQTVDLSEQYYKRIVEYMFSEYEKGRTPNPDVLCNREIKFDVFMDIALGLGADFVATGHYCRKDFQNGNYQLLAGKDKNKDQSYFLCQLNQKQLEKALFPIGELEKSEVRSIAKEQNLVTAEKKDSQGLCFIGKVKLPDFLKQKLQPSEGKVIEINPENDIYKNLNLSELKESSKPFIYKEEDGFEVGKHQGAHFYTIGQRKGLGIGGTPLPLFVIGLDTVKNIVYVGQGEEHPGLNRKGLFIVENEFHWVNPTFAIEIGDSFECEARIRYRQPLQKCVFTREKEGYYVQFDGYQKGITPGQFCAFYQGEELFASGVINA